MARKKEEKQMKVYLWEANMALIWQENLYLNEDWIIEVEVESPEEQLCKDYKLKDLEMLYKKYFLKEEV